ncbi:hypothetical protein M6B38_204820 [Iris pallida]|uniref:Uncharacterized protein n=1 Tax=Iris pallida TaxID=29817 RepID=A0AAX6E7Z0_IRIPA|nr:hypothetical protein M6B38_204820 [Iris pallida]
MLQHCHLYLLFIGAALAAIHWSCTCYHLLFFL